FYRSAELICRFAITESTNERTNSIFQQLSTLFQIHLSGTHASIAQRKSVIYDLLESSDERERQLGIRLIESALKTDHFVGAEYTFGAQLRDYGFRPSTRDEVYEWM